MNSNIVKCVLCPKTLANKASIQYVVNGDLNYCTLYYTS